VDEGVLFERLGEGGLGRAVGLLVVVVAVVAVVVVVVVVVVAAAAVTPGFVVGLVRDFAVMA